MKKTILAIASLAIAFSGIAQDRNVTSARMILSGSNPNLDEAKDDIDKAVQDPTTKDKPKTWATRGEVYFQMQQQPQYKAQSPYREAAKSYLKVIELKSDYDKETTNRALLACAYMYFNDGIAAYNNKKLTDAYDLMEYPIEIHNLEKGTRFAQYKGFDTIAANAMLVRANSAFYDNKSDVALPLFVMLKDNPITRNSSVYNTLADIYKNQNNDAQYFATLEEGRKMYPADEALRNAEINYYIKSGKQDELTRQLEDAVSKDPNNAEMQFNLGVQYYNMAYPKNQPVNMQYAQKSEDAYNKAIQLAPNNAGYDYNLGVLYFNQAGNINDEMNKQGTSAAEQKKYTELKAQRDSYFDKATMPLEKAYAIYDAKASTLKGEDRADYVATMTALRQIYASQSKMDKATALKAKMEAYGK